MDTVFAIIEDNFMVIGAGLVLICAIIGATLYLVSRLRDDIKLNRKVESISGKIVNEEATAVLRKMKDTTTEDTILRLFPTLIKTRTRLRQSGLRLQLAGYAAIILVVSAAISLVWNNPAIPSSFDLVEPLVNAVILHFAIGICFLGPAVGIRKKRLLTQLSASISHIARSLQAGQTTEAAIALAARAVPNPLQRELADAVKLSAVGISANEALKAVGPNIDLPEFDFFVAAIEAGDRSGGNLVRVLNELVGVIRSRNQLKMKIDAMTAEGKLSAVVLALLPIGIFGWLCISRKDYVEPLFSTLIGNMLMYGAFALIVIGMVVMLQMVKLKV